jgi:tetratricopeptide (TPR) repeat protein
MAFLARLFSKKADDYLVKGDRLFASHCFFEARTAYEDGLQRHLNGKDAETADDISRTFSAKIALANRALAELNIVEAEHALGRGAHAKAAEHLDLAKTLTDDLDLREKAEKLLANLVENINDTNKLAPHGSACASCASTEPESQAASHCEEPDLSPLDYYDLLIRQLPGDMYSRYAGLGEKFAYAYLAASRDDHAEALELLEEWYDGSSGDIYRYEKGMILYRLGNTHDAEASLHEAVAENAVNPLPHLGLALLLIDGGRLDEAAECLDTMITGEILPEHARMLRGDTCQLAGDMDGAIGHYGMLLPTPFARSAAEKLHDVLMQCDRRQEAAAVFKRYLGGCCH